MAHASLEKFRAVTDRNVLRLQEAKQAGRKVVGQYCIYTPLEMVLAAGAIPVSLCGTKNDSIPAAEAMLPRTLCPLIKSSFGFALQDSCPYLAASDLVVADTTCVEIYAGNSYELEFIRNGVYDAYDVYFRRAAQVKVSTPNKKGLIYVAAAATSQAAINTPGSIATIAGTVDNGAIKTKAASA